MQSDLNKSHQGLSSFFFLLERTSFNGLTDFLSIKKGFLFKYYKGKEHHILQGMKQKHCVNHSFNQF